MSSPKPREFVGPKEFGQVDHPDWVIPEGGDHWLYGAVLQHMACQEIKAYSKAHQSEWSILEIGSRVGLDRSKLSEYLNGHRRLPLSLLGQIAAEMCGIGIRSQSDLLSELNAAFHKTVATARRDGTPLPLISNPEMMGLSRAPGHSRPWPTLRDVRADSQPMAPRDPLPALTGIEAKVRAEIKTALRTIHDEVSEPDWVPDTPYKIRVHLQDGDKPWLGLRDVVDGYVIDSKIRAYFNLNRQWRTDTDAMKRRVIDGRFITYVFKHKDPGDASPGRVYRPNRVLALRALPENYHDHVPRNWYLTGSPATVNWSDPDDPTLSWEHDTLGAAAESARDIGFQLVVTYADNAPNS